MMQIKKLGKKTTMPDLTKINRTIRDMRKKIMLKTSFFEIQISHFIQKKILVNLKKQLVLVIIIIFGIKVKQIKTKLKD